MTDRDERPLVRVEVPASSPSGDRLDGVALLTLDRPQVMNALSFALLAELGTALAALDEDPNCRAIVITGAGERAFAAGVDIRELAAQSPSSLLEQDPFSVVERIPAMRVPVIAYMALIFGLSSVSRTPAFVSGVDKYLHAALYSGLGALVVRALAGGLRRPMTLTIVVGAIAITAGYGVSDEFHQSFVPLRSVEALDVVADTVGGSIAAFALYGWDIIRTRYAL